MDDDDLAVDDTLTGVLAHGLLGSMSVIKGTLSTVLAHRDRLDPETFAKLVQSAMVQADHVTETLKGIVQGLPREVLVVLDELNRQPH